MISSISIEFFPGSGPDTPLILIYGYEIALSRELFHAVRSLKEQREEEIVVHTLPGYSGIDGLELTFKVHEKNRGIQTRGDLRFTCELTFEGWAEVEDRLGPFCDRFASPGPFQRLDSSGDISLLFSTGRGW